MTQILLKAALSLFVIFFATWIGRKVPTLAGLVAVMPLVGVLVMVWMHIESGGNSMVMQQFSKGAFLGLAPTVLFFLAAFLCFRRQLALPLVLLISFGAWFAVAICHQWFLRR